MNLVGKHVVITGGTSGIGLELVKQLYQANSLSVLARPSNGLDALRKEFERVQVFETDLSDLKSVELTADQLIKTDRNIDVLINNAAVQYTPRFLDKDFAIETIKREIDINFTSVCTLIYLLLPGLMKTDPSIILNVNSGLAIAPKTNSAIYCATKAALNSFSKSLQFQLEDTNISVKQAFLPLVDTAMTKGRGKGKLTAEQAASEIIKVISSKSSKGDIGKVRLLRLINQLSPFLAARIMKAG